MPFPDCARVIYAKNPLDEVICQLRFPPVLRIESELPARFQEAIRDAFPLYTEAQATSPVAEVPPQIRKLLPREFLQGGAKTHQFASEDKRWILGLTRDAVALSTSNYERWDEFRERLAHPLEALLEQYQPAFFTRVGLRYQNVINRTKLGLAGVPWTTLLQPHILGEFSSTHILEDEIDQAARQARLRLPCGHVLIRHGLGTATDTKELCFFIDGDFYVDTKTEPNDANTTLDNFNSQAGRLFRWCIADRLHNAMEPSPI